MAENTASYSVAQAGEISPGAATPRWAQRVNDVLATADIRIGGDRPWDIRVNDARLFRRVLVGGVTALGDAYIDQWWDCDALDQFFDRALRANVASRLPFDLRATGSYLLQKLWNVQGPRRARRNAESHYNLGNDLFQIMLDPRMLYTCAIGRTRARWTRRRKPSWN